MSEAAIALITALINLAIKYAPEMIEQGKLAITLLTKDTELTDAEKEEINKASAAATAALQKRCDEQLAAAKEAGITE